MRVGGNKEGEGGKAMARAKMVAGEWTATATKRKESVGDEDERGKQGRGQWQGRQKQW